MGHSHRANAIEFAIAIFIFAKFQWSTIPIFVSMIFEKFAVAKPIALL